MAARTIWQRTMWFAHALVNTGNLVRVADFWPGSQMRLETEVCGAAPTHPADPLLGRRTHPQPCVRHHMRSRAA